MSHTPPKRSLRASPEQPRSGFNWPPTDGQLADNFGTLQRESSFDETSVKTADPSVAPASSEPRHAELDRPPASEGPMRSDAQYPEHSSIEDPTPSSMAVAQGEIELDGTSAGGWAAETARLQALIEGLTQKVEWRTVTGR